MTQANEIDTYYGNSAGIAYDFLKTVTVQQMDTWNSLDSKASSFTGFITAVFSIAITIGFSQISELNSDMIKFIIVIAALIPATLFYFVAYYGFQSIRLKGAVSHGTPTSIRSVGLIQADPRVFYASILKKIEEASNINALIIEEKSFMIAKLLRLGILSAIASLLWSITPSIGRLTGW